MATPHPSLHGLVLAGGRSTRLGEDKGSLEFHGVAQVRWLFDLLGSWCSTRLVSLRRDQLELPAYRNLPTVVDSEPSEGPTSGLLAAFRAAPEAAWLVVATDMPLLDQAVLQRLTAARQVTAIGTAYRHADGTPEPLCAIYEPRVRALLTSSKLRGSLRAALELGPTHWVTLEDARVLMNVNTPSDESLARRRLRLKNET